MTDRASGNVAAMSQMLVDLLLELAALAAPDKRRAAADLSITIGREVDALIDAVRLETGAAVSKTALELARTEVRLEAAEAAGARSLAALCETVASAPAAALGRSH